MESLPTHFPKYVHYKCKTKLKRHVTAHRVSKQSKTRVKHEQIWENKELPNFPKPAHRKMCGFCKVVPSIPHNSLTCPKRLAKQSTPGKPKRPLMSLVDRKQGKERIKDLVDFFDGFCKSNNENKKDVTAFLYRRQLNIEGKPKSARTFDSFHKQPSQILVKPFSPRKTASRAIMTGTSWNKSRDEYTFFSQMGVPVLAGPGETDMYRWGISPMNVSFSMESLDAKFKTEYEAPVKPLKPSRVDWTNREEKETLKKNYAKKRTEWKNSLR